MCSVHICTAYCAHCCENHMQCETMSLIYLWVCNWKWLMTRKSTQVLGIFRIIILSLVLLCVISAWDKPKQIQPPNSVPVKNVWIQCFCMDTCSTVPLWWEKHSLKLLWATGLHFFVNNYHAKAYEKVSNDHCDFPTSSSETRVKWTLAIYREPIWTNQSHWIFPMFSVTIDIYKKAGWLVVL